MSSLANWSYTATATHWPKTGRDGRTGVDVYGPPVTFSCDYSAESKRMTDATGIEFVSTLIIYTERSTIQPGDRVNLGTHTEASPVSAGALVVRSVSQYADTFDRVADDYKVAV